MKILNLAALAVIGLPFLSLTNRPHHPIRKKSGTMTVYDGIGAKVTAFSGVVGYSFTAPLEGFGHSETGPHGASATGSVISFTLGPAGGASGYACLIYNGTVEQSMTINGIGNYQFDAPPYTSNDYMEVYISSSTCPEDASAGHANGRSPK